MRRKEEDKEKEEQLIGCDVIGVWTRTRVRTIK